MTPIKRNFNVDLKNIRKYVEDCVLQTDENKDIINNI
jgi:hypothetical protein